MLYHRIVFQKKKYSIEYCLQKLNTSLSVIYIIDLKIIKLNKVIKKK